ncbi:MAG: zf-TFIIB domain-containing protein [Nitrospirae bacterium]|nr:zf-TFIIB domain-containing protein [Nitrospirota bacterium]
MICPICGGHIKDKTEDIPPCCPRCKKPLVTFTQKNETAASRPDNREYGNLPPPPQGEGRGRDGVYPGDKYELCQDCGGLWLDRGKFRMATRESDVYREESLIIHEYMKEPPEDTVTYIPCVRCGKIMNRKNFAKISGVIIDECGNHGVWLDAGELEKIRHFIADGGLERVQDREIEKNRVEIERLAIKVDQTAFIQRLLNFWNFKRWMFGE